MPTKLTARLLAGDFSYIPYRSLALPKTCSCRRLQGETFPGGSYLSLQILAFWLSWVRALHTKGNILRLHPRLVDVLKHWSTCEVYDMSKTESSEPLPGMVIEEEKALAGKVYSDFKRFGGAHDFPKDAEAGLIYGHETKVSDNFMGALPADSQNLRNEGGEGRPEFIPSDTFDGEKEGYVFRKGESGAVGYYWDSASKGGEAARKTDTSCLQGNDADERAMPPPPPSFVQASTAAGDDDLNLTNRERGNKCFVDQRYEEALHFYGAALASGEKIDLDEIDGGEECTEEQPNESATPFSSNVQISEVVEQDAKVR